MWPETGYANEKRTISPAFILSEKFPARQWGERVPNKDVSQIILI